MYDGVLDIVETAHRYRSVNDVVILRHSWAGEKIRHSLLHCRLCSCYKVAEYANGIDEQYTGHNINGAITRQRLESSLHR